MIYSGPEDATDPAAAANGTTQGLSTAGCRPAHFDGLYATFPDLQPSSISYWGSSGSTSAADTYFVISGDGSTDNTVGGIIFLDIGQIRLFAKGIDAMAYTANTWYHIEFRNIDWTAQTFDLHIDGVPLATDVAFMDSVSSMDRIDLYNFDAATARWDEIYIN